jgi:hypothetical protein
MMAKRATDGGAATTRIRTASAPAEVSCHGYRLVIMSDV